MTDADVPEGYELIYKDVMSNLDHEINPKSAARLVSDMVVMGYSAWNFKGYVWLDRDQNKYVCEVWQYHNPVERMCAESLSELMGVVSDKYGHE